MCSFHGPSASMKCSLFQGIPKMACSSFVQGRWLEIGGEQTERGTRGDAVDPAPHSKLDDACPESKFKNNVNFTFCFYLFFVFLNILKFCFVVLLFCSSSLPSWSPSSYSYCSSSDYSSASYSLLTSSNSA